MFAARLLLKHNPKKAIVHSSMNQYEMRMIEEESDSDNEQLPDPRLAQSILNGNKNEFCTYMPPYNDIIRTKNRSDCGLNTKKTRKLPSNYIKINEIEFKNAINRNNNDNSSNNNNNVDSDESTDWVRGCCNVKKPKKNELHQLGCDGIIYGRHCNRWYHLSCIKSICKLNDKKLNEYINDENKKWICPICRGLMES